MGWRSPEQRIGKEIDWQVNPQVHKVTRSKRECIAIVGNEVMWQNQWPKSPLTQKRKAWARQENKGLCVRNA